jgi:hypothetical protein
MNACRASYVNIGHDVETVGRMGWAGKKNGELLTAMASAGFECLTRFDQNIPHQQNVLKSGIAVLILKTRTNRLSELEALVPRCLEALTTIAAGQVLTVRG